MEPGDHIIASDVLHTHHGIYLGPGCVAQYGSDEDKRTARVEIVSESVFARGRPMHVANSPARFTPEEIASRVESRLGEQNYDLFGNNCEHFVTWARTGRHASRQVDRAAERSASAVSKLLVRAASSAIERHTGRLAVRAFSRGATGWLVAADAAQFGVELTMSKRGVDPLRAEETGRAVGLAASAGIGAITAGPMGLVAGCGLWIVGELIGKQVTDRAFESAAPPPTVPNRQT